MSYIVLPMDSEYWWVSAEREAGVGSDAYYGRASSRDFSEKISIKSAGTQLLLCYREIADLHHNSQRQYPPIP